MMTSQKVLLESATQPSNAGADKFDAMIARIEVKAKGAGVTLKAGASEAAITRLETKLGLKLPDEVKAFYRKHNGVKAGGVAGYSLLSIRDILNNWGSWNEVTEDPDEEQEDDGFFVDAGVQGKFFWIPQWVPVTDSGSGDHHVLDLAPAQGGLSGQIVSFWHDHPERRIVAKSFLSWLADTAEWCGPEE